MGLVIAFLLAIIGYAIAYVRYRREMAQIRAAVSAGSTIAQTSMGPIEYGCDGVGPAVLVIHGASGGYDQGLLIGRANFPNGYRIIAPSRFGYLRTPLPRDASPAAQANAHAALLDTLGIERAIVLGFSAGARSALQLALHHPARVSALILENTVMAAPFRPPDLTKHPIGRAVIRVAAKSVDFPYWLGLKLAPNLMIRFSGAPAHLYARASNADRAFLFEIMRRMLPLSSRLAGLANDAVNVAEDWPIETITVPCFIVAAADDWFKPLPHARAMAARIRNAKLLVFDTGSHLFVGCHEKIRSDLADFLGRAGDRPKLGDETGRDRRSSYAQACASR